MTEALDAAVARDADHRCCAPPGANDGRGDRRRQPRRRRGAARLGDRDRRPLRGDDGQRPEFTQCWFGILRSGAIEVPVHSAHRGPLLEHILAESGARVLFCDAEFVPRLVGLELPGLERIVVRGEVEGESPDLPAVSLEEVLASPPAAELPRLEIADIACILYTSGTTGRSKGVVLPHGANLKLARANIALMEYTADDVLYTAFPLFHVNAKFTSVTSAMLAGARLVLDDRFSASTFWPKMAAEGVTSFNYMGGLLAMLEKQPEKETDRGHGVIRAYGGACPPPLWEPFEERFGVRLHEHYGMTETGITIQNTRRCAGSARSAWPRPTTPCGWPTSTTSRWR